MEGLGVDYWEAKVCAARSRAVYFPIQPDLSQLVTIILCLILLKNYENILVNTQMKTNNF